ARGPRARGGGGEDGHLPKAGVRRLWLWLKVCAVYVDARRACVEQLKAQTEWYWGPGCRVDRDGVLIAYGQAHELDRLELPSAQDRRPKQNRRIGPERVRIREREATELPPPIVRRVLGDPTSTVRMPIVLPDLLKTGDVRVQLVQPGHNLMATLP